MPERNTKANGARPDQVSANPPDDSFLLAETQLR